MLDQAGGRPMTCVYLDISHPSQHTGSSVDSEYTISKGDHRMFHL